MKKIMVIGSTVAAMAFMSCANPMITDSVVVEETVVEETVVEETVVEETVVEEVQVVDTITLTPSAVFVNLGDTITLTPVVTYHMVSRDLAAESEITWTSSNSDMTVVDGVVTAIYGGETTITATQDGVSATTDLTFVDPDHDYRLIGTWQLNAFGSLNDYYTIDRNTIIIMGSSDQWNWSTDNVNLHMINGSSFQDWNYSFTDMNTLILSDPTNSRGTATFFRK